MIYNKQLAGMLPNSIASALSTDSLTGIVLCSGTIPDDATWDTAGTATITTAGSFIYNQTLANTGGVVAPGVGNASGVGVYLVDSSAIPPAWYVAWPSPPTATATKAGTIGWAVIYRNPDFLFAVDVSLPNQGGILQVDKTTVGVGDVVSVLGFSFSMWR